NLPLTLPEGGVVAEPAVLPPVPDARKAVRAALADPIGTPPLREIARGKRTATIVINDITRPCPTQLLLEEMLPELTAAGVREEDVTLLVATGNHRPNTPEE